MAHWPWLRAGRHPRGPDAYLQYLYFNVENRVENESILGSCLDHGFWVYNGLDWVRAR